MTKLTSKQRTEAIARYARKHNHYAATVRSCTSLFLAALKEYRDARATNSK